jgi:uncharacterized heparinase superfamily protein
MARSGHRTGGRLIEHVHARLAGRGTSDSGFVSQPEPRTIGSFARGRQIMTGTFLIAGSTVEGGQTPIWSLPVPGPRFEAALHGFAWLDDLAAVGDPRAREKAQAWTWGWIDRFGQGAGPGWTPDLTGRRIIRWLSHAGLLLAGRDRTAADRYFASLARQTRYLARRWPTANGGLARIEALTGLLHAVLALRGFADLLPGVTQALSDEATATIDADGAIPSRNPEMLLEIFTLLTWAAAALSDGGRSAPAAHLAALERIAHVLRALRHADGGLARFHGGGRGAEGRLDEALAHAPGKATTSPGLAMGFARLAAGRTTIIVDAAAPPKGPGSENAHASTLALEVTSGRRPLIVNCGSGRSFGEDWHRAGRATPSHSTGMLAGLSSSRLGARGRSAGLLTDVPRLVWVQQETDVDGLRLLAGHDGYEKTHGITHARHMRLSLDGRVLSGEDTFAAMSAADRGLFDAAVRKSRSAVKAEVRFHLHPDVDAALDLGGTAVSMALKSGEIWILRHVGDDVSMRLDTSVYLEAGRPRPRATLQVVLAGAIRDHVCHIGWTLAKAQDTPSVIRDIAPASDDD